MGYSEKEKRNLQIATDMYEQVLMSFNPANLEKFFPDNYKQHGALATDGLAGLRDFLTDAQTRFPDVDLKIVRAFADDDFVIFHVRGRLAPTEPEAAIVDIFRMENDKIAEHWEVIQEVPETLMHNNGMF